MAENTHKLENTIKKKPRPWLSFRFLEKTITLDATSLERGLSIQYIPKMFFLAFLGVIYIANAHFAERNVRKANMLEGEIENIRAKYTSLKADYDRLTGKKAEIAEKVQKLGLIESKGKIQKIIVKSSTKQANQTK